MGLYDCRCMITGVSLKGADAALVLLQQKANAYHPIALAIKGNYNRLGSIDGIQEDTNTELVLQFFLDRLQAGSFIVAAKYLQIHGHYPIEDIEQLLACFERNINDKHDAAVLNGQPVVFALICRAIWDTLARSAPAGEEAASSWFEQLFANVEVAKELYQGSLTRVSKHLQEMFAVSNYVAGRGIAWKPADDPGQDYPEEMRQYLAEARQTFHDSAVVLDGLKRYEREVSDLLKDED